MASHSIVFHLRSIVLQICSIWVQQILEIKTNRHKTCLTPLIFNWLHSCCFAIELSIWCMNCAYLIQVRSKEICQGVGYVFDLNKQSFTLSRIKYILNLPFLNSSKSYTFPEPALTEKKIRWVKECISGQKGPSQSALFFLNFFCTGVWASRAHPLKIKSCFAILSKTCTYTGLRGLDR